jgi:hypothetical protein
MRRSAIVFNGVSIFNLDLKARHEQKWRAAVKARIIRLLTLWSHSPSSACRRHYSPRFTSYEEQRTNTGILFHKKPLPICAASSLGCGGRFTRSQKDHGGA